jgi:hypothetical protein
MFYCSVSQVKNWILKDPLLDYLNFYGDKSLKSSPFFKEADFTPFIMDMGNKWEEHVVKQLITKASSLNLSHFSVERKQGYHQTKECLNKGVDIIFQAQVKDWKRNISGYPDILIKKKAFLTLFKDFTSSVNHELSKLKDNTYIVIDIKYSSVDSKDDGFIDEKSLYHRYIRSQIAMYTNLNGAHSSIGFIISKDPSSLTTPVATYTNDRCLIEDYEAAIKWLMDLKEFGSKWTIGCRKELLPNMNNYMDDGWREYKQKIAEEHGELSLLNGVGDVLRSNLHSLGIFSYKDDNFINYIDKCDIGEKTKYLIKTLRNNLMEEKEEIDFLSLTSSSSLYSVMYVYVDIESCMKFSFDKTKSYITSIAVKYNDLSVCFIKDGLTDETDIVRSFKDLLKNLSDKKDIVLVHYTSTEENFFKNNNINYTRIDLYDLVNKGINEFNESVLKLCKYDLTLKSLTSNFMYKKCFIKSGKEVLTLYNVFALLPTNIKKEIIKYNIADCESLELLHKYFIKIGILI